jgi:hypothetical protein
MVSSPTPTTTTTGGKAHPEKKKKGLYASHLALQDQLGRRDVYATVGTMGYAKGAAVNALGLQEAWSPRAAAVPVPREPPTAPDVDRDGATTDH